LINRRSNYPHSRFPEPKIESLARRTVDEECARAGRGDLADRVLALVGADLGEYGEKLEIVAEVVARLEWQGDRVPTLNELAAGNQASRNPKSVFLFGERRWGTVAAAIQALADDNSLDNVLARRRAALDGSLGNTNPKAKE
jgi:hypothetical protein